MPVHDEKHIKAKLKEFGSVIKTKFLGDKIPKENKNYTSITCITIMLREWKKKSANTK